MAQAGLMSQDVFRRYQKELVHEGMNDREGDELAFDEDAWEDQPWPYAGNVEFEWSDAELRDHIDAMQNFKRTKFAIKDPGVVTPIADPVMRQSATAKLNDVAQLAYKCGFRFVRILARGGFGWAVLMEFKHKCGAWYPYVLKVGFEGNQRDHEVMRELARAKHIVQHISALTLNKDHDREIQEGGRPDDDLQDSLDAPEPCEEPYEEDLSDFDNDQSLLLMEYCRHGDLGQAIARSNLAADNARNKGSRMTEPILWRMFQCLNKGVIALAYPPIHQPGFDDVQPRGVPITETVPPAGERTFINFVHFDIDPSNIFITELEQRVHSEVPLFKLGDFGTTIQVDDEFMSNDQKLWRARRLGKLGHKAPEQWSKHWDTVTENPRQEGIEVAGHYGCLTNVYQIAAVMFSAIVGQGVPQPPIAKKFEVPVVGPNGNEREARYTIGWELLELELYNTLSDELRELVADCLSLDPRHRPSECELEGLIAQGIRDHPMTDADHAIVKSIYLVGKDWKSPAKPWTPKEQIDPGKAAEEEEIEMEPVGGANPGHKRKPEGGLGSEKSKRTKGM